MSLFDAVGGDKSASSTDNTPLIKLLGSRLISRKNVKAIEGKDGAWRPATDTGKADGKRLPFTMDDFNRHLVGDLTLGHYVLGTDDTCKFFLFDIDVDKEGYYLDMSETDGVADQIMEGGVNCNPREAWNDPTHPGHEYFRHQVYALALGLGHMIDKTLGIPVAITDSGGKGCHVYGLCGTRPAAAVRDLALGALNHHELFAPSRGENFFKHKFSYENITIEVFPKQSSLEGKDLGNLVRLPLGVNRRTGQRSRFLRIRGLDGVIEMDPIRALEGDAPWE